jgi:hypothetical protein
MSPDEASEGGRGLMVVDALSVRWGWQRHRIGKMMWSLIAT